MAKNKKEQQLQFGQMPIPQGQKEYSKLKLDWSGLNRRQVIDTGVLSMESNISTAEAPYLVPSPKRKDITEEAYKNPISMFGFDGFLVVIYRDDDVLKLDYIVLTKSGEIQDIHTGIISDNVKKDTDSVQRSMVQFNVYENSTDVLDGVYVKKLLLFPDKVSMYMKIETITEKPNGLYVNGEITDTDVMYCYNGNDGKAYYIWNGTDFQGIGGNGYFTLDSLDVEVKEFYNDGYQKVESGTYYNDGYKKMTTNYYNDGYAPTKYKTFYDGYTKAKPGTYSAENGITYYQRITSTTPYVYTVASPTEGESVAGLYERDTDTDETLTITTFYSRDTENYPYEYRKCTKDLQKDDDVTDLYEKVTDTYREYTPTTLYERNWNKETGTYSYTKVTDMLTTGKSDISNYYEKISDKDIEPVAYYERSGSEKPYTYEAVTDLDYGDNVSKYYIKTDDYSPPEGSSKSCYWKNTHNKMCYVYSEETTDGESGFAISVPPSFPNLKYATVHLSRLFGVDDDRVHVSGFNDYSNWNLDTVTESNESNAWSSAAQANTKANGEFTGVAVYDNHVVCFKRDFMHEIYNNKNPFRLVDIYAEGCIDNRSIQEVDGRLIFVSADGVKIYTGSNPRAIGYNLGIDCFTYAVSGSDGRNYYLYCEDKAYNGYLFVYDTLVGQWSQQAIDKGVWVLNFARNKNGMYAFFSNGLIYKMDTGKYNHEWSFETDMSTALTTSSSSSYPTVSVKHITKIQMLVYAEGSFKVYALYDNEEFNADTSHLLYDSNGKTGLIPVRLKPRMTANYGFKLHFEGTGYVRLYGMELRVSAGGELFV